MTRRLLLPLLAALSLTSLPAGAQQSPVKAVADLEDAWAAAFGRKDFGAIEKLLADDFMWVSEDGKLFDKPGYMAMIRSFPGAGTPARNEKMQAKEYGNTVVINGVFVSGGDSGERIYWTDTWRKIGTEWKCVAGQSTRIK